MKLRKAAYTLDAIIEAGISATVARTLLADGPQAVPERALLKVGGRKRTKEPTTRYIWGPDAAVLLAGSTAPKKP